jgi:hypothetical protein
MRKIFNIIILLLLFSVLYANNSLAQTFGMTPEKEEMEGRVLSSENGRFVFGQISRSDKDKFMLDTHTGRLWRISENSKVGMYLKPVKYQNSKGEYTELPEEISGAKSNKDKK